MPKTFAIFEFDGGDGVEPNSIAVHIGATADATFDALGTVVAATVPIAVKALDTTKNVLSFSDTSAALTGFYVVVDVNQADTFTTDYPEPDAFGVRDAQQGFTFVQ